MKKIFLVTITILISFSIFTGCELFFPPEPDLRVEVLRTDAYYSYAGFITGFSVSNIFGDAVASSIQYEFNLYGSLGIWIPHTLHPAPSEPGNLVYRFPTIVADGESTGVILWGDTFPYIPFSYDLTVTYKNFHTGKAMSPIYLSGSLTMNP